MGVDVGSSKGSGMHFSAVDDMEEDDQGLSNINDLGKENLVSLCKKATTLFFDEYGLISHQINSYNEFISYGLQNVFDSFGELNVDPGFDPSKKGDKDWRYASVRFGKVTLDQPTFWGGEGNVKEFKMLPKHARLQRMTYSSKIKVEVHVQVYIQKLVRSDKFKTGKEQYVDKESVMEDSREITVGRLPVMVKSDICWMKGAHKGDCDHDLGGYFLIKGAEKVS